VEGRDAARFGQEHQLEVVRAHGLHDLGHVQQSAWGDLQTGLLAHLSLDGVVHGLIPVDAPTRE
jgi:hypothetical protein